MDYDIEVSTNGSSWTKVATDSCDFNMARGTSFAKTAAKYVRLSVKWSDAPSSYIWETEVAEFEIYGSDPNDNDCGSLNLADERNGTIATGSGQGSYAGYTAYPTEAIDGALTDGEDRSFWAASSVPAWLKVQLPQKCSLGRVKLYPIERDMDYTLSYSSNGSSFSTMAADSCYGSTPETTTFSSKTGKYIKLDVDWTDAPGGYMWKTETDEIEIYRD